MEERWEGSEIDSKTRIEAEKKTSIEIAKETTHEQQREKKDDTQEQESVDSEGAWQIALAVTGTSSSIWSLVGRMHRRLLDHS